ncbi:hypothetical protein BH20ACI4_BH20ACI4_02970 [soil metagenome]
MKRLFLFSLIICSTLLLAGCSYSNDFFIANNSDGILEIEFKWNENLYVTPYKFKFEKFNDKIVERLEAVGSFTKEEIESAEQTNTFRVTLDPNQALRIHSIISEENEKTRTTIDKSFRINFLRLKGKNGTIELTGDQIWFQFRQVENDYFIVYK